LLSRAIAGAESAAVHAWQATERHARRLYDMLGGTWPSGAMGLGVMLMLLAFLLSYYLVPGL
jgi:hypothetical protein